MALVAMAASADMSTRSASVSNLKVERSNTNLIVEMTIGAPESKIKSNNQLLLTPVITNGRDSLALRPVVIAGRARRIQNARRGTYEEAIQCPYSADLAVPYSVMVPYQPWMEVSELVLVADASGCCKVQSHDVSPLARIDFAPRVFAPELVFVTPVAEAVKTRSVRGSAFIDFKVNQTVILPDFRRNPQELGKIRASIDTVRNNKDTRITHVAITGYASPEGSYANNVRLAEGRTQALSDYVQSLYSFAPGVITTNSVPEDWDGVRRFLDDNPDFANSQAILDIVNSSAEPDEIDRLIKVRYPQQYAYMLQNLYPALRHSDYTVEYVVRSYSDPAEIAAVLATAPQNLSLQELYTLARSLPEGSDQYNEVFETAVRMYPADPAANLNAAVSALGRNDFTSARRYLDKAGTSPQATYARGILAARLGDNDTALQLLRQAAGQGVEQAADAAAQLQRVMEAL